jgi:hypothetical protein
MACPHGFDGTQQAAVDEDEKSSCCGWRVTFMDDGYGGWVLCCKCCKAEVSGGEHVQSVVIDLPRGVSTDQGGNK